jgi:peptidoglycan/xylan/chitin deacetylase (PgdA/CDA1 family)
MAGERPVTRRLLLTAGGLTLLAGCSTTPPSRGGQTKTLTKSPVAAREPEATGEFAGDREPATAHPALTPPPGTAGTPDPRLAARSDQPMFYIDDGPRAIALTIDDGPNPIYTPQILALLARHNVTASFSMIGISVQQYPAIARDVAAAGHVITNHTWQHLYLPALPAAAACFQMDRATEAIQRVTGQIPAFFRAPYGSWSATVLDRCAQTGMTPVDWSVDPRDWAQPGVPSIVENILRNTRTGSIILEHDGGGNRAQTVAALRIVIPRLLDAGYQFYPL